MPKGSSAKAATASANARPFGPGTRRPTRWLMTIYDAQPAAAPSAKSRPSVVTAPPLNDSNATPAAAIAAQARSSGLREAAIATPRGPTNSIVTATPRGMRAIAS